MRSEFRLADLLGPFAADAEALIVDAEGHVALVLLRDTSLGEIAQGVALQQALGRGLMVLC
jgi:hypothetical protein